MDIVISPNPILKKVLSPITDITPDIIDLITEMRKTMIQAKGVGLAANQVGKDLQLFVIDKELAEEHNIPDAYINPEIIEYSKDLQDMEEGCLSLPEYWRPIKRSKKIKLKAIDIQGNKLKIKAKGFLARVFQHEYDHLQGTLIKDRAIDK